MDIEQKLKQIGLKSSESAVYVYLLKNGLSSPPQIAKGTKITRTNTYQILQSLQEKSLIQRQKNRKRFAYVAKNPESLLTQAERIKIATEELLPELKALHRANANKPSIQFYYGWDEVKQIYLVTLEAESIHAIGSLQKLDSMAQKFLDEYQTQIKKRHIIFYDVLTAESKKTGEDTKQFLGELYSVRYLNARFGDIPTDILIWNDNIALISLEEPIFGTVITNTHLAQTFRALHMSLKS